MRLFKVIIKHEKKINKPQAHIGVTKQIIKNKTVFLEQRDEIQTPVQLEKTKKKTPKRILFNERRIYSQYEICVDIDKFRIIFSIHVFHCQFNKRIALSSVRAYYAQRKIKKKN